MDTEYYDILGVNKDAPQGQIRKSYYKLAKEYHPDKAPEEKMEEYTQKFQKISEAYEILSDNEKRQKYDQFGKESTDGSGGNRGGVDPFDIFSQFFGNQSGFSFGGGSGGNNSFMKKRKKKSAPVVHQVNIKLEDLFKGKTVKLKITKKTIFDKNINEPCPIDKLDETWITCNDCNGNGVKMELRQMAPGFMTQSQSTCGKCLGTGNILLEGYEMKDHPEIFKIEVKRGMDYRKEHIIEEGGNCYPGTYPGDIIISFNIIPHSIFKLRSNDLIMNKKILLSEALCGTVFDINHLDNTVLQIKSKNIITPGVVKTIKNQGMYDKFDIRGDLLIHFEIEFPESLLIHQKKNIKKYLPKSDKSDNNQNKPDHTIDI